MPTKYASPWKIEATYVHPYSSVLQLKRISGQGGLDTREYRE
jgi:hypothetical protein